MSSNVVGNGYMEANAVYYLDQVRRYIAQNRAGKTSSNAYTPSYTLQATDSATITDSVATPSIAIGTFTILDDRTLQPLFLNFDYDYIDKSGNNNIGTLTGTETYGTSVSKTFDGRVAAGFSFGGADYITFNDTPFDFERTDSFSLSYWKKQTSKAAIYGIISKRTSDTASGWSIATDTSGHEHFRLVNTNTTNELDVKYAIDVSDGLWRHFCWVYTGTSIPSGVTLYINGTSTSLTTVTNNLSATILNNTNLTIGAHSTVNIVPSGTVMDETTIYSTNLTSTNASDLAKFLQISKNGAVTQPAYAGFFDLAA